MESFFIFMGKSFILILISLGLYLSIEDYERTENLFSAAFTLTFFLIAFVMYVGWWLHG